MFVYSYLRMSSKDYMKTAKFMPVDLSRVFNPIYATRDSVRDPCAVYHDGTFYLYYTVMSEPSRWCSPHTYRLEMTTTRDFVRFTPPQVISPFGYASPGNVMFVEGRWLMSAQRYPWPTAIVVLESKDLVTWSKPRQVIGADTGLFWSKKHGPIDGFLFGWQDKLYLVFTNQTRDKEAQQVGLAVAEDLEHFTVLTPDRPLLDSSAYDQVQGVENCSILVQGDTLYLFVSVGMAEQKVARVKSRDLFHWPALTPEHEIAGLNQEWSRHYACAQFVADWRDSLGAYVMFYMGCRHKDPFERMALGMAVSNDLDHWEPRSEMIPETQYQVLAKEDLKLRTIETAN